MCAVIFPMRDAVAFDTNTKTAIIKSQVLAGERMAVHTMRFTSVLSTGAKTAKNIYTMSNGLQVIGVDTARHATKMIKH